MKDVILKVACFVVLMGFGDMLSVAAAREGGVAQAELSETARIEFAAGALRHGAYVPALPRVEDGMHHVYLEMNSRHDQSGSIVFAQALEKTPRRGLVFAPRLGERTARATPNTSSRLTTKPRQGDSIQYNQVQSSQRIAPVQRSRGMLGALVGVFR